MKVIGEALTFDDVSLIPSYSDVLPKDVSLETRLTTELNLNVPLISAAMDTVTEARLAIAMAQEGGIGVVHKNMSLQYQAEQVRIVKKYEAGVIKDPITVNPNTTISEVLRVAQQFEEAEAPSLAPHEPIPYEATSLETDGVLPAAESDLSAERETRPATNELTLERLT